ncbi:ABC transporter ATP-binding protein [Leptospira kanakyensis]|uniref:ABC transporter ATP-binding protein n=1 Tax=Leptospira kanakyensis TaxID=2484968 RepID=UPI00223D783E|nr:ABC transporter ATP-binding protein [Leptospira kanakyensis]MCW7482149.1 ABC transporter ATP-binding protein/permease [Leptospira kanakyensis]
MIKISDEYNKLWCLLTKRRKIQYFFVLNLIIITAFAEVVSLGAVIPFLGVLISPEKVYEIQKLHYIWDFLGIKSSEEILLPVTILFASGAFFAGGLRLGFLYISTRLSYAVGADLSIEIYTRTLFQPYSIHVSRNSAEVIAGITTKANGVVAYVLQPFLTLVSSILILIIISIGLVAIDPLVTIIAFTLFGLLYFLIAYQAKRKLLRDGLIASKSQAVLQKSLQEGLGAIRDVILDGTQKFYINLYSKADIPFRKAQGASQFTSSSPKYAVEAIGMVMIAVFAYQLSKSTDNILSTIPLLGSLAMGAQRLLPILQQSYTAWAYLNIGKSTLSDVIQLLEQPFYIAETESSTDHLFLKTNGLESSIILKDISFRYAEDLPYVMSNVSLKISKGHRVGFIGKTGSGKSTLIDIIMGLLTPTDGVILVDDEIISPINVGSWQRSIAHVPQSIYLSDSTISENIAFGVPISEIDSDRVKDAARKAQIADHIESLKSGYNTIVGERGIRLSGGQRQRIGIARALYKKASVIVFDEATSALDNETEKAVMQAIEGLGRDLTILMIAHRLSTVENCDMIVKCEDGKVAFFDSKSFFQSS